MDKKREIIALYKGIFIGIILAATALAILIGDKTTNNTKKLVQVVENNHIKAPDNLWKGVIGEAVSEGYEGIYAVICVYKNRINKGMPLGCVALKRKDLDTFVDKQDKKWKYIAKELVEYVFNGKGSDITNGATHYENIEKFGEPPWAPDMVITCKIKNHTFYKEK